jgi:hypothetical protein
MTLLDVLFRLAVGLSLDLEVDLLDEQPMKDANNPTQSCK